MKRVVVTGAAGCIGRAVSEHLTARGLEVVGVGRSTPATMPSVTEWVTADVARDPLSKAFESADGVIHLAALVHHPEISDSARYREINVDGTRRALEAWRNLGEAPERFVLSSSVAVYGYDHDFTADESTPCDPRTPYARSKLEAEEITVAAGGKVLRFPVVYGPRDRGNVGRLINAIARGRFVLPRHSAEKRSMLAAANAAHALCLALESEVSEQLFLVTDDDDVSLERLTRSIASALSPPRRLITVPRTFVWSAAVAGSAIGRLGIRAPVSLEVWKKLTRPLAFSCERAKSALGFEPPMTFEEGIRIAVEGAEL